ncbi:MAG: septum formation inhibitor Maf [Betaproteobacteria bacterium]|nr:septum formation inhibitor Maf [Betaproteobacteria bacterium]
MIPSGLRVYLASRSLRRRELLRQIGVSYEVLVLRERAERGTDVDESMRPGESAEDYVRRVCADKVAAGWRAVVQRKYFRHPVLAADTAVCLGDTIFGKPRDRQDAERMLAALAGREHRVLTAVALQSGEWMELALSESFVTIRALAKAEIAAYLDTGEAADKAGAYAIQGKAAAFIAALRGSYSGVMGLPLYETAMLIERLRE